VTLTHVEGLNGTNLERSRTFCHLGFDSALNRTRLYPVVALLINRPFVAITFPTLDDSVLLFVFLYASGYVNQFYECHDR